MSSAPSTPVTAAAVRHFDGVHIGGEARPGTAVPIESVDPATGQVWARVSAAGPEQLAEAVAAARHCLDTSWSRVDPGERGACLYRLADLLLDHRDTLAALETTDNGKPLRDTTDEITRSARWLRFFAGAADKLYGQTIPMGRELEVRTYRKPYGVIAAITPWNSPIYQYAWKLGPTLAAGNTVVLKPSELAPVTATVLAGLVGEAGFPPGAVNVVAGDGSVGAALVDAPGIDKVTFTGGTGTGRTVAAAAGRRLIPATLECGGKTPLLVFADADLDLAVDITARVGFRSAGQSCAQVSRVLIARPVYERFLDRLAERARALRVGDPAAAGTDVGPVISAAARDRIVASIEAATRAGHRLVAGGAAQSARAGFFVTPTVFADVGPGSALWRTEVFGPVVAAAAFDGEDEAVALANDSDYGLVAAVCTADANRAARVAHAMETGVVCVNTYRPGHWQVPYGGRKNSGFGLENGLEAMHEYSVPQTHVVGTASDPRRS
ncbi:MAG TPA: aldehyde dehydrogenase family protein [Actinophytocola sp.]|jgi:aldehyde dehydrogenase (NAD+)|nr:aldehyde dehydrogenase family protein [Actinophytocola sp.]